MIQSVWKNLTGLQKAAEHLWCDFKWATNSSPNTNDLYIHYMDKSTGTPSLEEKMQVDTPVCRSERLTERDRVVDFEAAQDLVNVPGVSKPVPSHHHLKRLWNTDSHRRCSKHLRSEYQLFSAHGSA